MVNLTDKDSVYDVVFVVEDTANLGAYMPYLKKEYIQPALENFNGGPPEEMDYGCDQSCSLYGVVTYCGIDCFPEPSSNCLKPTTSIFQALTDLTDLRYVGGGGDGTSFLAEGLATAVALFDDLQKIRNLSVSTVKHCILLCNSSPCVLPSQDSLNYNGFTSEELINKLQQRDVNFSIISPRKIPSLFKLFDKNYTDYHLKKNYAVDSRHLILLKGFQLEERPISPGAKREDPAIEDSKKPAASVASNPLPGTARGYPDQLTNPTLSSAQTAAAGPFKMPTQATAAGGSAAASYMEAKQAAQEILQQVSISQGPNAPPAPAPQSGLVGPGQVNPVQTRGMNPQMATAGGMYPQIRPPPGRGVNVMNPQQNVGPPGQAVMNPQHPPGMNPVPTPGSEAMGMNTAPMNTDTTNMMDPSQEKRVIWTGMLEWQEKSKTQTPQGPVETGNKISRNLGCNVSLCLGEMNINTAHWPNKLQMQLIPQHLLTPLQGLFRNSRTVYFTFANHDMEGLRSLYKVMATGFAGCVHIPSGAQSDVRVFMLLYSNRKRQFMGLVPNDQARFITGIKTVIANQRQIQSQQRQAEKTTSKMGGPGAFPGQAVQPGMNTAVQGMQGMPNSSSMGNASQPQAGSTMGGGNMLSSMANMGNNTMSATSMVGASSASAGNMMGSGGAGTMNTQQQQSSIPGPVTPDDMIDRRANLQKIEQLKQSLDVLQAKEMQFQQSNQQIPGVPQSQQQQMMGGNMMGGMTSSGPRQPAPGAAGPGVNPMSQQHHLRLQQMQQQQQQQALQTSNPQLRHLLLQQQMRQQQLMQQGGQQPQPRSMAPPQGMMGAPQGMQMPQQRASFNTGGLPDNYEF